MDTIMSQSAGHNVIGLGLVEMLKTFWVLVLVYFLCKFKDKNWNILNNEAKNLKFFTFFKNFSSFSQKISIFFSKISIFPYGHSEIRILFGHYILALYIEFKLEFYQLFLSFSYGYYRFMLFQFWLKIKNLINFLWTKCVF
jgi:hypothetical protein